MSIECALASTYFSKSCTLQPENHHKVWKYIFTLTAILIKIYCCDIRYKQNPVWTLKKVIEFSSVISFPLTGQCICRWPVILFFISYGTASQYGPWIDSSIIHLQTSASSSDFLQSLHFNILLASQSTAPIHLSPGLPAGRLFYTYLSMSFCVSYSPSISLRDPTA